MTRGRDGRTRRWWAAATALFAVAAIAVLGGTQSVAASAPPAAAAAFSWSNGEVVCVSDGSMPRATVTAAGHAGAGLSMAVGNLTQVTLLGVAAATASLTSASWSVANVSSATDFAVNYTAHVPVYETALLTLGLQIGTVTVVAAFSMGNYSPSAHPPADAYAVDLSLSIVGWPWLATLGAGPLLANLSVAPAAPLVHLTTGSGNATVNATESTSGATMAYLSLGTTANVTAGGTPATIPVLGSLLAVAAGGASLSVNFTTAAMGASAVNYTSAAFVEPAAVIPPTIQIPGAPPIPTADFLAVGGAGVLVSLAVAGAARRLRRSPSDLEYVLEEEVP